MLFKGKGKISYIDGTGPISDDPKLQALDEDRSMIMSEYVIQCSQILLEISCSFLQCGILERRFRRPTPWSKVLQWFTNWKPKFHLQYTVFSLLLNLQKPQIHHYKNKTKSAEVLLEFLDGIGFEFLTGLNMEYDQERVQALRKDRLPPLSEVFSIIWAK